MVVVTQDSPYDLTLAIFTIRNVYHYAHLLCMSGYTFLPPAKWHHNSSDGICLYVCNTITFESLHLESLFFGMQV